MAAALDFNLGSATPTSGGITAALTTTHLASAGTRIVVLFSYFLAANDVTLAGGGLTWHRDLQVLNGSDRFELWSAPAPAGLASGTTLTFTRTVTGNFGGVLIGAVSISGVDMTQNGGVDNTGSTTTTGTNWSSGAASAVLGGISIGGSGAEAASTTETATATNPATLLHHLYNTTDGQGFATAYLVVAPGAAGAVAGTFVGSSTASTGGLVIYAAAASVDAPIPQPLLTLMGVPMFGQQPPLPFGLIPDQPPVQAPAGIWLPATTTPSPRNRSSFFVVRGRQVKAVPNQETPIVEQRSPGVRREPPRLSRGARPFPVQPQIAVPTPVIGNRIDSQRGKITSAQRGRQWSVVPPQATVVLIWVPRQVPGHRRVILPSRGRVFAPVPAQVTVPVIVFPNRVDSQRSKIAALYRGKRWDVIQPQVVVVSVWIPTFISPNSTFY